MYEGSGPGEIGMTLEGASFLDRSLELEYGDDKVNFVIVKC